MAKKTNRVKSDNKLITVTGWRHADDLLRQIGDAQLAIQAAEAAAAQSIADAKACLAIAAKPLHEQIKTITLSLEAFATHSRHDFEGKKSKDLNFGTLGWRMSTSISVSTKYTLELTKQVFKRRAKRYIHVKETPDKDALAKLTDEDLAAVKARRIVKDDFLAAQTLSNINAAGKAAILQPIPNATPVAVVEYTEGEIFGIDVTQAAGSACTCTADVYGTLKAA